MLLGLLFAIAAAVAVGLLLSRVPGYVLIAYGTTRVEFTLFVFVLIYLMVLVLGGGLWALWRRLLGIPGALGRHRRRRSEERAARSLTTGLVALAEGRLAIAERALEQAASGGLKLPALLAAARAADSAGARDRRDAYLRRADKEVPRAGPAVLLTQARLELDRGDCERALATLQRLRGERTAHPMVLRQLARVYVSLGEHGNLLKLLDDLLRFKALPEADVARLAATALAGALADPASEPDILWRQLPRALRSRSDLRRVLAGAYTERGEPRRALALLERNLGAGFSPEDARAVASLQELSPETRLKLLNEWRKKYGDKPELLREAGRVALELGLWGQARSFFEGAGSAGDSPELAGLLGRLAEHEGRRDEALAAYRAGLKQLLDAPGHGD